MVVRMALLAIGLAGFILFDESPLRRAGLGILGGAVLIGWPPLGLLAGFVWALPWIQNGATRRRLREARRRAFPDMLLALRLAAEDGHGAVHALEGLPPAHFGPLSPALEAFRDDLQATFDARRALASLRRSLDFPEGQGLVDALLAGEVLGVPLRETLAYQDSVLRASRLARSRERASYFPYALTLVAGLSLINSAIVFGYPHLLALLANVGLSSGKGILP